MLTWCVSLSSSAPVKRSDPKVSVHSGRLRLDTLGWNKHEEHRRGEPSARYQQAQSGRMPAPRFSGRLGMDTERKALCLDPGLLEGGPSRAVVCLPRTCRPVADP